MSQPPFYKKTLPFCPTKPGVHLLFPHPLSPRPHRPLAATAPRSLASLAGHHALTRAACFASLACSASFVLTHATRTNEEGRSRGKGSPFPAKCSTWTVSRVALTLYAPDAVRHKSRMEDLHQKPRKHELGLILPFICPDFVLPRKFPNRYFYGDHRCFLLLVNYVLSLFGLCSLTFVELQYKFLQEISGSAYKNVHTTNSSMTFEGVGLIYRLYEGAGSELPGFLSAVLPLTA